MGVSIRERPKGSGEWWIFANHRGIRKAKKIGSDKQLARETAKNIEARLVLGDLDIEDFNSKRPTLKKYCELWLSLPTERSNRTQRRYRENLRKHIYPSLGGREIDQIKRKDIKTLLDTLSQKMKISSLGNIKIVLSQVFKHALESEIIELNPVSGITLKGKEKFKVDPLTEEKAFDLLEQAKVYKEGMFYPHLLTLLRTGLRVGELCGLQWDDIDFKERFIRVSRTLTEKELSSPKNGKERTVDMTPHLTETLKALKVKKQKEALRYGHPFSEWVFVRKNGKPLNEVIVRKALHRCLEGAGLPRMRTHDLRHSYATIRLMRGHDIGDVSYQLGHSSIKITYDIYTHWIPGKFKDQVDDLDMQLDATYVQPEKMLEN